MELKPGSRWRSAVCGAEFVVVRPPKVPGELQCGGQPVRPIAEPAGDPLPIDPALSDGVAIGKRYFDSESGIELLVSKPGQGALTIDGRKLALKEAKALPSSD